MGAPFNRSESSDSVQIGGNDTHPAKQRKIPAEVGASTAEEHGAIAGYIPLVLLFIHCGQGAPEPSFLKSYSVFLVPILAMQICKLLSSFPDGEHLWSMDTKRTLPTN